jgi:hypothetical protein
MRWEERTKDGYRRIIQSVSQFHGSSKRYCERFLFLLRQPPRQRTPPIIFPFVMSLQVAMPVTYRGGVIVLGPLESEPPPIRVFPHRAMWAFIALAHHGPPIPASYCYTHGPIHILSYHMPIRDRKTKSDHGKLSRSKLLRIPIFDTIRLFWTLQC